MTRSVETRVALILSQVPMTSVGFREGAGSTVTTMAAATTFHSVAVVDETGQERVAHSEQLDLLKLLYSGLDQSRRTSFWPALWYGFCSKNAQVVAHATLELGEVGDLRFPQPGTIPAETAAAFVQLLFAVRSKLSMQTPRFTDDDLDTLESKIRTVLDQRTAIQGQHPDHPKNVLHYLIIELG